MVDNAALLSTILTLTHLTGKFACRFAVGCASLSSPLHDNSFPDLGKCKFDHGSSYKTILYRDVLPLLIAASRHPSSNARTKLEILILLSMPLTAQSVAVAVVSSNTIVLLACDAVLVVCNNRTRLRCRL